MIGNVVETYKILKVIGGGSFGDVYLAKHQRIELYVAIKVLHASYLEEGKAAERERFRNEARAANAIRHPNIVEIRSMGELEDGRPYIIMDYLNGDTLKQRLDKSSPLGIAEAIEIASQIASALQAAHEKNIIHRDLKPDNLILVPDLYASSARMRVKLVDFGIARLRSPLYQGASLTATGLILGTPLYMSPEQADDSRRNGGLDHRTDIYSLGCILYEMICGSPPFQAETWPSLLAMHLFKAPAPPSQSRPGIPQALELAILRALQKRPSDRFASMRDFHQALMAVREPAPDNTRGSRPPRSTWRRIVFAFSAVAGLAASSIGVVKWRNSTAATSVRPGAASHAPSIDAQSSDLQQSRVDLDRPRDLGEMPSRSLGKPINVANDREEIRRAPVPREQPNVGAKKRDIPADPTLQSAESLGVKPDPLLNGPVMRISLFGKISGAKESLRENRGRFQQGLGCDYAALKENEIHFCIKKGISGFSLLAVRQDGLSPQQIAILKKCSPAVPKGKPDSDAHKYQLVRMKGALFPPGHCDFEEPM